MKGHRACGLLEKIQMCNDIEMFLETQQTTDELVRLRIGCWLSLYCIAHAKAESIC